MNILLPAVIILAIVFVIVIIYGLLRPYNGPPEGEREHLEWLAARGNPWAQHTLLMLEGTDLLFAIVWGYTEVVKDAGIEITPDNPAHTKLVTAQIELHDWIVRFQEEGQ